MKKLILILIGLLTLPAGAQTYGLYQNCQLQTAMGQAVAGAQVYFLTQPANTSSLTPQVAVYADSSGTGGSVTQPLATNGFGMCTAYLIPGIYTVCYVSPFTGQLCYADQVIPSLIVPPIINPGSNGEFPYYASNGTTLSPLAPAVALADLGGAALTGASFSGQIVAPSYANPNGVVIPPGATGYTGTGNVVLSLSPMFGALTATNVTDSNLTSGNCVQASTNGLLVTVSGACGTSSGTVTITGSPTSGQMTAFSGGTSITNASQANLGTLIDLPQYSIPYSAGTTSALTDVASPTVNDTYALGWNVTGSAAVAPSAINLTTSFDAIGSASTAQSNAETFSANAGNISNGTVGISYLPTGTNSSSVVKGGTIASGGPIGGATSIPVITYNAAGQLTAVTTATPAVTTVNGASFPTASTANTVAVVTSANNISYEAVPNAALASQTANTVLGALTATNPSGLALPSCSAANNALTWTTSTGFGCNTISGAATAHAIVFSDMANVVYTSSQVVGIFYSPVAGTVPSGGTGTYNGIAATSYCYLTTAATASTTFTFADNGTSFGTVVFAISGTTGTFTISSAKAVSSGDKITLTAPSSADSTAAGLNCSLVFAY